MTPGTIATGRHARHGRNPPSVWRRIGRACACVAFFHLFPAAVCLGVELSAAEVEYVRGHGPVTMCVDPDWIPFEWINEQGEHEGIAADLNRLVAERTGLRFELVRTRSWDESLALSKEGGCQVLSFLNQTPEREKWLLFTEPLFSDPNVFITREEHPFIADPGDLIDETIVFPSGTSMEEIVRRRYPNLAVRTVGTENEAIGMVSGKQADMTLRSLIVAAYTIKKEGLFNLKIAGQLPNYTNNLRMGVVRDEPLLRAILDKGIRTISRQERARIVNEHVSINVQTVVDYALAVKILLGFGVLAIVGFYWNYRLKAHNAELERISRTDALTGLPNRLSLNAVFQAESTRAKRYGHPLSIIMLDIDHFKMVNDELGHLAGDALLVAIAQAIRKTIRDCDVVGRWGGEEFLVLCPETDATGAMLVAQRIRQAVRDAATPARRAHTISGGVAELAPDETVDALLSRADKALYRAKDTGRDRVCGVEKEGETETEAEGT